MIRPSKHHTAAEQAERKNTMTALHGEEAIIYLESLKRYEFKAACKRPIGQRVTYYKIQAEWINEMLQEEYKKVL